MTSYDDVVERDSALSLRFFRSLLMLLLSEASFRCHFRRRCRVIADVAVVIVAAVGRVCNRRHPRRHRTNERLRARLRGRDEDESDEDRFRSRQRFRDCC